MCTKNVNCSFPSYPSVPFSLATISSSMVGWTNGSARISQDYGKSKDEQNQPHIGVSGLLCLYEEFQKLMAVADISVVLLREREEKE